MFRLKIATDNAAFDKEGGGTGVEIARILREIASKVERGVTGANNPVMDINGNKVGTWTL
jgi:hypothetical protein